MRCVASPRGLSRESADSEWKHGELQHPTSRWRDKSAAIDQAHVVGWVHVFWHRGALSCWLFIPKHKQIQHFVRQPHYHASRIRP